VPQFEETAERPSGAAVTVVDQALGLRPEDLQRLSELLLQELGAFVMPAAITWCETVEDLYVLVDQLLQRRSR
jgi:hypothetical protein